MVVLFAGGADRPAAYTIGACWPGQKVMVALNDAHAVTLLEHLFADVQASARQISDAADCDRPFPCSATSWRRTGGETPPPDIGAVWQP